VREFGLYLDGKELRDKTKKFIYHYRIITTKMQSGTQLKLFPEQKNYYNFSWKRSDGAEFHLVTELSPDTKFFEPFIQDRRNLIIGDYRLFRERRATSQATRDVMQAFNEVVTNHTIKRIDYGCELEYLLGGIPYPFHVKTDEGEVPYERARQVTQEMIKRLSQLTQKDVALTLMQEDGEELVTIDSKVN